MRRFLSRAVQQNHFLINCFQTFSGGSRISQTMGHGAHCTEHRIPTPIYPTLTPPFEQTDTCENITLQQFRWLSANILYCLAHFQLEGLESDYIFNINQKVGISLTSH